MRHENNFIDEQADNAPRHIRYALQEMEKGRRLVINEKEGRAAFLDGPRELPVNLGVALRIKRDRPDLVGAHAHETEPEPMTETEDYRSTSELAKKYSSIPDVRKKLGAAAKAGEITGRKSGNNRTARWSFRMDDTLRAWLKAQMDEASGNKSAKPQKKSVPDPSGDGAPDAQSPGAPDNPPAAGQDPPSAPAPDGSVLRESDIARLSQADAILKALYRSLVVEEGLDGEAIILNEARRRLSDVLYHAMKNGRWTS